MEHPEAVEAVRWWTSMVSGAPMHDSGDSMLSAMLSLTANQAETPTESDREALAESLLPMLNARIDEEIRAGEWGKDSNAIVLSTDYGPEGMLACAVAQAGISSLHLPVKTRMWISEGVVSLACGYGARTEEVWRG